MKNSLIVPVAADKPEYSDTLPYVFALGEDGIIVCIKSILGLPLKQFDAIYFTILGKHDERFFVADSLQLQCRRLNLDKVRIVLLDSPTDNQVETVYATIKKENIEGAIYVKDADSYFESADTGRNGVAIFPIEEMELLAPRDKSYVAVDDMYYITNIIEKFVVGHNISAGGYAFENSGEFCLYYDKLKHYGHLYLSHIIYAMLLDKKTFRPFMVKKYRDWGSKEMLKI